MPEKKYVRNDKELDKYFCDPSVEGVYESQVIFVIFSVFLIIWGKHFETYVLLLFSISESKLETVFVRRSYNLYASPVGA